MIIGQLFQDDINRKINGVVKVDQDATDVLVQELDEYVITRDLKKHFITFFNNYGAVSYTHLDVYKRQTQGCSKNTILPLWSTSTARKRVLTHNSWHSTVSALSITVSQPMRQENPGIVSMR